MMRLVYSPANQAYVFLFGESIERMGDSSMFFRNKRDAIEAAKRQGLHVEKDGRVVSSGGLGGAESNILYETSNLYLYRTRKGLEIRLQSGTHSVVVGNPKDEESGRRFMDRAERDGAKNLKRMYGVL